MSAAINQEEALRELERLAPGVPLLALGQTVFWDEPMKAGVVQALRAFGDQRDFVAGVHDTDYFAKYTSKGSKEGYEALTHNDTTTKGLWSAAGEFCSLFGSETVISLKALAEAGAKVSLVGHSRPGVLDEMTEAWGWRGVVSRQKEQQITSEKKLDRILPSLFDTFEWALDASLEAVGPVDRPEAEHRRNEIIEIVCEAAELGPSATLADWYQAVLPKMYNWVAGAEVPISTTRTSHLLRFNQQTCGLPRFELVDIFLRPESAEKARKAYDDCLTGSEIYTLDRFGVGALPFDLVIPGVGRGTLRLGSRGGLVMCPKPVGFSYKTRPNTVAELATIVEAKFGADCVLVGKAVTLIGMLGREFAFVFHEGGSSYVWRSRKLHQALNHKVNPILRVTYEPWDVFGMCKSWLKLPEPLRRTFGCDEISTESFSTMWRKVAATEAQRLTDLGGLTRTLDLIAYLQTTIAGPWEQIAEEYARIHKQLECLQAKIKALREERRELVALAHELRQKRAALQKTRGDHWRAKIWQREATAFEMAEREQFLIQEEDVRMEIRGTWDKWRAVKAKQDELCNSNDITKLKKRRAEIALEAELTRMKLIREAVIASEGLAKAGHRPAAWWFPVTCPDRDWYTNTVQAAKYSLEPLY